LAGTAAASAVQQGGFIMGEWFRSGGFGMISLLVLGLGSLVVGALAVGKPTKGKLTALRSLPELIMLNAVFAFGTNLWAVNQSLSDDAFIKTRSITGDQLPFVGILGITESGQVLTLGGLLAMFVVVLRMVAEARAAKGSEKQA
jgi:hypothetical protein